MSIMAHTPAHTGIRGNENARLFDYGEEPVVTEEPVITEEPAIKEEPKKDENWKQEYYSILSNLSSNYRFCLVYLNQDDIPELIVSNDNSHVSSAEIYTYINGKAVSVGTAGTFGEFYFIPKKNTIVSYSTYGGENETTVYKISGSSLTVDTVYFDNEYGAVPENVYFTINDTAVSSDEYHRQYDSLISSAQSKAGYDVGYQNIPDQMNHVLSEPEQVILD